MKRIGMALLALMLLLSACARPAPETQPAPTPEAQAGSPTPAPEAPEQGEVAVYLGVQDYGALDASQRASFRYRFFRDGETVAYAIAPDADCTLQNALQEGRAYRIETAGDTLVRVSEPERITGTVERSDAGSVRIAGETCTYARVYRFDPAPGGPRMSETAPEAGERLCAVADGETLYLMPAPAPYTPPVSGTPGERTVENFLRTALMPVGTTLYVYGGGWNWQDDAASVQSRSIGLPAEWVAFFQTQDASYSYKSGDAAHSWYPFGRWNEYYYAGADCSGYVGWALFNTFCDADGESGFVTYADRIAGDLSDRGWGMLLSPSAALKPGDIVSMSGHVWICLGVCADGSVVVAHSTPSASRSGAPGGGVQLSALGGSTSCEAYRLAEDYMSRFYPQWTERYPVVLRSPGEYRTGVLFRWDTDADGGLSDPAGVQDLPADAVLRLLFGS